MNFLSKTRNPIKADSIVKTDDLRIFYHCIYEYRKGVRNLLLTTENSMYIDYIQQRLVQENIDYVIQEVSTDRINVFFGAKDCVDVVRSFVHKKLNELTPEQDFILGIMLGYGRLAQCERYLKHSKNNALNFLFSK